MLFSVEAFYFYLKKNRVFIEIFIVNEKNHLYVLYFGLKKLVGII